MITIDMHALARENMLAATEMYTIASIAAQRATERNGYAIVVTADPSIAGVSVRDAVHDVRVYLRCTPVHRDAGRSTDVYRMTLDIAIDVSNVTPQLTSLLVRAINADGEQIGDVLLGTEQFSTRNVEGYAAIGDFISEHIVTLL